MKIIIKDRAMGKTSQLVQISEATGYPIVTGSIVGVEAVKDRAKELGCNIPEPMTVKDLKLGKARGRRGYENILVDEVCIGGVLHDALNQYFGCNVVACTCSPDYTDEEIKAMLDGGFDKLPKRSITITC